ncbi:IS66 family insertion sequence element accessory protein TnpB [Paraburkholderia sp. D1E]|uniref:IS66 family insertion sequence element accessory protein TnpB n=1 Tax=Paraburkholderia sp. D1E TaxID=3461398 RepID=UPI004045FB63
MQLDPFARAVFSFHNRQRNQVRLLFYDRNGFWMMLRCLEEDHVVRPRQPAERRQADERAVKLAPGGH